MNFRNLEDVIKELHDSAERYLSQKYTDDEFTFLKELDAVPGSSVSKMLFSSKNYPDGVICVMYIPSNNVYYDTYMGLKYRDTTYNTILDILKKLYSDKVFMLCEPSSLGFTVGGSDKMTFEAYAAEKTSSIFFMAIVGTDIRGRDKDALMNELADALKQHSITCTAKIYFTGDKCDVTKLTVDNYYWDHIEKNRYDASLYLKYDVHEGILNNEWQVLNDDG